MNRKYLFEIEIFWSM